jgi:hypothetical protein
VTFDGRKPYWHHFAKEGEYNVCLTVSNENGSNKFCRIIRLGDPISSTKTEEMAKISLFPNPVEDYLLVTLGEYIPKYGQIMIYDISGRTVRTQRIYHGQNNVDMTGLMSGIYLLRISDGNVVIKEEKVVKI